MNKLPNIVATAAIPFAFTLAVNAQEDAGSITVVADESVLADQVTAFKTGTELINTPRSLSVYTAEQIDQQAVDSIGDIIDYTPGVITSQGEGHRDSVVFRGVRSTADFYVNGLRDDVQYYRSLYNLEQVEILKGPSALFFGRGGAGGVLNRVTKTADLNENFSKYKASVDSFGGTEASVDINQVLSDKVALRVNAFSETLRNHRDFFDGDRFGFNPTLHIEFNRDTTLDLSYEYSDHERFIDRGIPSAGNSPASQFAGTTFGDSELNLNEFEGHAFTAKLTHYFNDNWKGTATAAYGNYNKTYTNYFASDFDEVTNQVEIDGYRDSVDRDRFTLAGDLVGEFHTGSIGHKLVLGAEYVRTESDSVRFNNVFDSNGDDQQFFDANGFRLSNGVVRAVDGSITDFGTFSELNDDTRAELEVFSFYIQDEIALHEKLDLVLGARFDSFDIKVNNVEPGADFGVSSRRDNEISPKIGLVYKPTESVSIYGSYTESFLPRSGEQFADINGDDARLDPDEFSNLEFGVKWNINDDLLLSASAFEITQTTLSENTGGTFDQFDSDIQGFELQLQGYITDRWQISAGYGYLDGEVTAGFGDATEIGNRPQELAEHTLSLWNQYQATDKLSLGLGLIYQDESFADEDNTVVLPSYVRVDASASYAVSDSLKLQLNVENLLDKDYFPNAHTNQNITVGAPINATFTVSKSF